MHVELSKLVQFLEKSKFFFTKKACLQKKAIFGSFVPGQIVDPPSPIDYHGFDVSVSSNKFWLL